MANENNALLELRAEFVRLQEQSVIALRHLAGYEESERLRIDTPATTPADRVLAERHWMLDQTLPRDYIEGDARNAMAFLHETVRRRIDSDVPTEDEVVDSVRSDAWTRGYAAAVRDAATRSLPSNDVGIETANLRDYWLKYLTAEFRTVSDMERLAMLDWLYKILVQIETPDVEPFEARLHAALIISREALLQVCESNGQHAELACNALARGNDILAHRDDGRGHRLLGTPPAVEVGTSIAANPSKSPDILGSTEDSKAGLDIEERQKESRNRKHFTLEAAIWPLIRIRDTNPDVADQAQAEIDALINAAIMQDVSSDDVAVALASEFHGIQIPERSEDSERLDWLEAHWGTAILPVEGNIVPAGTWCLEPADAKTDDDVFMRATVREAIDAAREATP